MTLIFIYKLILGIIFSSLTATLGYLAGLLQFSGVMTSILIGTLIIGVGPWYSILLLGLFFASSGLIHLLKNNWDILQKETLSQKGGQRDAQQVLANSLPATISLLAFFLTQQISFLVGFVSGISGATADTWASEIGILSKSAPRNILTGKAMLSGQSGGVTVLGSFASVLGALLISSSYFLFSVMANQFQLVPFYLALIPFLTGCCNSLIDSFLGAAIQASYRCSVCGQLTEKKSHHDQPAQLVNGLSMFNNDGVNFLSGIATVLISIGLSLLWK